MNNLHWNPTHEIHVTKMAGELGENIIFLWIYSGTGALVSTNEVVIHYFLRFVSVMAMQVWE